MFLLISQIEGIKDTMVISQGTSVLLFHLYIAQVLQNH